VWSLIGGVGRGEVWCQAESRRQEVLQEKRRRGENRKRGQAVVMENVQPKRVKREQSYLDYLQTRGLELITNSSEERGEKRANVRCHN